MGRSVEVFRQNAIERDTLLAERAEAAERLERQVAERTTELRDALDQQLATAEVLQVMNNSTGNMMTVFETVLRRRPSYVDIDSGILWIYDGTRFHAAALRGVPPAYRAYIENSGPRRGRSSPISWAGKDVVYVPDLAGSGTYERAETSCVALWWICAGREPV